MKIFRKLITVLMVLFLFLSYSGCSFAEAINSSTSGNITNELKLPENLTNSSKIENTSTGIYTDENDLYGVNPADDFTNPINFDYLKNVLIFLPEELDNLPSYYDLRQQGRVTPIKDQGSIGTCWIFAAIGALESSLLPGETWNFSENNMKNILSETYPEGFDRTYKGGGDWLAALAYFTRYSGPVLASLDPYNTNNGISPPGLKPAKDVQECVIIPPRNNSLDNAQYKWAIIKYGAVDTDMYFSGPPYYNNKNYAYYYKGASINHAICLVGWDDNFDKNKFTIKPPGNGAFIARNSWGTDFGDGGYFYISYYDTALAHWGSCAFTNTEPVSNYNQVYQYDPFGAVNLTGFTCSTAWVSNIYTANTTNPLAATSFYALTPNSTYNLSVYLNPLNGNPKSGTLAYSKSGIIGTPGYKTIHFDNYVPLNLGQVFSVVMKITTPGLLSPVAYEYPLINYCSKANASFGEGFISSDGVSWMDMAGIVANASVCLKAFTVSAAELSLNQETNNQNPQLGDLLQLTIKLINQGPDTALGVSVNDKLPAGLSFLSYSANYGTYDPFTGVWSVGDIPYKSTATLIINCLVNQLGSYINRVTVNSLTYSSLPKTSELEINVEPVNKNLGSGFVSATTIPLKNTGMPISLLLMAVVLVIGELIILNKKYK